MIMKAKRSFFDLLFKNLLSHIGFLPLTIDRGDLYEWAYNYFPSLSRTECFQCFVPSEAKCSTLVSELTVHPSNAAMATVQVVGILTLLSLSSEWQGWIKIFFLWSNWSVQKTVQNQFCNTHYICGLFDWHFSETVFQYAAIIVLWLMVHIQPEECRL